MGGSTPSKLAFMLMRASLCASVMSMCSCGSMYLVLKYVVYVLGPSAASHSMRAAVLIGTVTR